MRIQWRRAFWMRHLIMGCCRRGGKWENFEILMWWSWLWGNHRILRATIQRANDSRSTKERKNSENCIQPSRHGALNQRKSRRHETFYCPSGRPWAQRIYVRKKVASAVDCEPLGRTRKDLMACSYCISLGHSSRNWPNTESEALSRPLQKRN